MRRRILLGCLLLSACSSSSETSDEQRGKLASEEPSKLVAATSRPVTYYRDVKPIVDEKCTQCHMVGGGGHFSLQTYDDVKRLAGAVGHAVAEGIMPPWRAAGPLGQYAGDRRLTDEQKSILLGWVEQGAPEGDPSDAPRREPTPRRGLKRVDASLGIGTYMPKDGDDYRCFVLDWDNEETTYITGLSIEPGDKELVHHGIVYLVSPERAQSVRDADAKDPEPGYRCMGGTGAWLTSYEPGGYGEENPGGVGFRVRPHSVLMVQMHYNTLSKKGPDNTRVEVTFEKEVDRVGEVDLITVMSGNRLKIPAGQKDVKHRYQGRPATFQSAGTYDFFWADLHAHTRATSMKMGIIRSGETEEENLLNIPEWSFAWQETYLFKKPVRFYPGDKMYVECIFDNTAENQPIVNGERLPVRDVYWGERTVDEMCLGNVLSVRVPDTELSDAERRRAEEGRRRAEEERAARDREEEAEERAEAEDEEEDEEEDEDARDDDRESDED